MDSITRKAARAMPKLTKLWRKFFAKSANHMSFWNSHLTDTTSDNTAHQVSIYQSVA